MNPNQSNQTKIVALVAVIVLVSAWYLFVRGTAPASSVTEGTNTNPPATTTTADLAGVTLGITGTGGYTIKEEPIGLVSDSTKSPVDGPVGNNVPKAPDYNIPLAFSASAGLREAQKSVLQAKAAGLRAQLAKDSSNYTAWLALGSTFKTAGDYPQAEIIWKYVSLQWPADAVVLGNLGDLYMNFIKDYPKADASYLGAIRNNPRQTNAYRNLFQLYSSMYTTHASAAEDILKKGIQNNPEALDLYVLLARHYRDLGRMAEARAEYNMAIVIAKGQTSVGAASILADIIAEREAL